MQRHMKHFQKLYFELCPTIGQPFIEFCVIMFSRGGNSTTEKHSLVVVVMTINMQCVCDRKIIILYIFITL